MIQQQYGDVEKEADDKADKTGTADADTEQPTTATLVEPSAGVSADSGQSGAVSKTPSSASGKAVEDSDNSSGNNEGDTNM